MSGDPRVDRRKTSGEFRTEPRSSAASLMVLMVSAVLVITAAATAILGGGFDSATPHGRLLGTLQRVADAQEVHHRETGRFAAWRGALEVDVPDDVELTVVRADAERWEALVEAPAVGLSCSLAGSWSAEGAQREEPACYRRDG